MIENKEKPREIHLDCGHSIWLKAPWPNIGETLWCSACARYELVGPMHEMQVVYHDTWRSVKKSRRYHGECMGIDGKGCGYVFHGVNFYTVRAKLENHYVREHVNSTLIFHEPIEIPDRLPANSPPPF